MARTSAHRRPNSGSNLNAAVIPIPWTWKRNARRANLLPLYTLSEAIPSPPLPLLQLMKYESAAVFVLLRLMMKHQGKTEENYPVALWCFFAITVCYWLIVGVMKETTITDLSCEWIERLRRAALASAILSAVPLACIFLKYPLSLVPLVVFITLPVSFMVLYAFSLVIEWVVNKMHVVLVWARRAMSCAPTEGEGEGEGEGC